MKHIPAAMIFIGLMLLAVVAFAQETNSEYLKQIIRLQYTEVCSTALPKGDALPNALDAALKQDPKTWLPWVLWWNATREKYEKGRCGDA